MLHQVCQHQSHLVEHKFSLTFRHEPEPYVRTTAETPTAATATKAPGADENDDDPDDEHEYNM